MLDLDQTFPNNNVNGKSTVKGLLDPFNVQPFVGRVRAIDMDLDGFPELFMTLAMQPTSGA
jgi:hypothetical protein